MAKKEKGAMNQYMPRYVETKTGPPILNKEAIMPKRTEERPVIRHWACTVCGYVGPESRVFMDRWDFTIMKHCQVCKDRTEHQIKERKP